MQCWFNLLEDFASEDLRRIALDLAARWSQNTDVIVEKTIALATHNGLQRTQFEHLHRWIDEHVVAKSEQTYRALALTAFRAGDAGNAWNFWHQCSRLHFDAHFTQHPIDTAMTALLQHNTDKVADAEDRVRRLRSLMSAEHWKHDSLAQLWAKEVESEMQHPLPTEMQTYWTDKVVQAMQAAVHEGNFGPTEALLTDDFTYIDKRVPGAESMNTIERDAWVRCNRLWQNGPRFGITLTCDSVTVTERENYALVICNWISQAPDYTLAWQQVDTLVPPSGGSQRPGADDPNKSKSNFRDWRIKTRSVRPTRLRFDQQTFNMGKDGWDALDAAVEQRTDPREKARYMFVALRCQEGLRLAKQFAEENNARDQAIVALLAYGAGVPDVMHDAARRAVEIEPTLSVMPFLRSLATELHASEQPESIGRDVTCRPPNFFQQVPKEFLGKEQETLGAWRTTPDSLVALFVIADETDIDAVTTKFSQTRETGFAAKLVSRRLRTINDCPAIELTHQALGLGYAFTNVGRPTVQRFVFIKRHDHILVGLVIAYAHEFVRRDCEFETFLKTMRFTANGENE
ncbi:MAG: hypothetical protein R3C05_09915 [Pirellulaceae bacterium]